MSDTTEKQKNKVEEATKNGLSTKVNKKTNNDNLNNNSDSWLTRTMISGLITLVLLLIFAYQVQSNNDFVTNLSLAQVRSQHAANSVDDAITSSDKKVIEHSYSALLKDQEVLQVVFTELDEFSDDVAVESSVKEWDKINKNINTINKYKDTLVLLNKVAADLSTEIPLFQKQYDEVIERMLVTGSSPKQIILAKNQVILSESLLSAVNALNGAKKDVFVESRAFKQQVNTITGTLKGQLDGKNSANGAEKVYDSLTIQKLKSLSKLYESSIKPSLMKMNTDSVKLKLVHNGYKKINESNENIHENLIKVDTDILTKLSVIIPGLFMIVFLIFVVFSFFQYMRSLQSVEDKQSVLVREKQQRETEAEMQRAAKIQEENDRNQTAILRLLDELGDLADGDLTVNATVSEDFTGAIADSVNFAIDQLRQLVSAINRTAISVAGSSEDTQSTAMQLAESSEHQAQEIAGASAAINEMAVSIDQVSANAVESATVADRSVAIAYNGAEVVQRTIDGMNTIREQIQETSKRIKRLGESSQEIGDIISLINDIADQTNILALNAAIQASSAGEAGRGFAVVADEVQRLAERSANATKQIESLVKTIQSDTNEAVISMEVTTSEVVKGAKLAKDAGEALEEVQTVSNTLADLIQNISNAARQQAASAGHISNTMNIIQEITTQTTAGTIATARSVGQLSEMSISLRESVSGFTLPDEDDDISLSNV